MFCPRDQLIKQQCGPTLTKYMFFCLALFTKCRQHHDLKLLPMLSAFQTAVSSGHRQSLVNSSGGVASKMSKMGEGYGRWLSKNLYRNDAL